MSNVIIVIWMIILFILYHKFFTVYYFSLGHGLLREVCVIGALAAVMTYITLCLWWVMAIIVIYFGYKSYKKSGNKKILIAAIIIAMWFSGWAIGEKEAYAENVNEVAIEETAFIYNVNL